MKVAVVQPYLFPYLGYYQLVSAVDTFVFFDDVNFIVKGWINRNNILQNGNAYKFTLPLKKASQNKLINEIEIADFVNWRKDFLKLIYHNYNKAPFFNKSYEWLSDFLHENDHSLISELAAASIRSVASLLGMETKFVNSSQLHYLNNATVSGQEKILSICSILCAGSYLNPRNGTSLYQSERFIEKNVDLKFIEMLKLQYNQFGEQVFVPNLSIIDVLMFNDIVAVKRLLSLYTLR